MLRYKLALLATLISWTTEVDADTGDTTCKDSGLDWYTSKVGETPCVFMLPSLKHEHLIDQPPLQVVRMSY